MKPQKANAARVVVAARQRCLTCGHPRQEHRYPSACTVPKCPCGEYAEQALTA